jgi:iron-sulfur cluster assembly protein
MESIIRFTDAAAQHIKEMLTKQTNGMGFRLSIKKTGCSGYAYVPKIIDEVIATDIHFLAQEGLPVYIDPNCEPFVKGLVIDYIAEELGVGIKQKRLVFINPNEKNRCGCGESFTIE